MNGDISKKDSEIEAKNLSYVTADRREVLRIVIGINGIIVTS